MTDPKTPLPLRDSKSSGPILVVDDEEIIRKFATRILLEAGFDVHEAVDGVEALNVVHSLGQSLECVVSDIVMPRLNGVDFMQRLSVSHPELPVILMSGYGVGQLTGLGISVPCSVLGKPFSAEILIAEVRRCLKGRPQTRW